MDMRGNIGNLHFKRLSNQALRVQLLPLNEYMNTSTTIISIFTLLKDLNYQYFLSYSQINYTYH